MRTIGLPVAAVLLVTLAVSAPPEPSSDAEADERFHADAKATLETTLEVRRALLLEDPKTARAAMDRLHAGCRILEIEEADIFGEEIVAFDRAFHTALRRARRYAGAGGVDAAYDEFMWVDRTCRACHLAARQRGLLPESGPL